ncbi:MAG TPA: holo-ACP synthase [Longimicrobiales bacterium]|nr:holo-ACP synthase [Longimicrobiales bacterium]
MAIVGIGIDLVEAERLARFVGNRGPEFERWTCTPAEIGRLDRAPDRIAALAAWFAAKEACLKALGTGSSTEVSLRDIEVVPDKHGGASLRLHGGAKRLARARGVASMQLTFSDAEGVVAAFVVLEG